MRLGYITPSERTPKQEAAHHNALTLMRHHALPVPQLSKGQKLCLFDLWKDPTVVADVGFAFDRIHQQTGSCVWAGGTNAVFSTIAAQRLASDAPTLAFLPFTLQNYAMSRHYMGDDGQGEGSMGSTFAKSLTGDGIENWTKAVMDYSDSDGVEVSGQTEMAWSSYRNPAVSAMVAKSKAHLFGSATQANDTNAIKGLILNGYGVAFACNNYIGNGHIEGSGADAYVTGHWDGRGGHQQSIHAYWEHPNDGPLFWAQNNWPGSTYPRDPAGGPICGVWVKEADVAAALRLDAEVYGYSHLNWFPAQPKIQNWIF